MTKHTCNPFLGDSNCASCELGEPVPKSPYAPIVKDLDQGPDGLVSIMRSWANEIAQRYGHPVYLVGSALRGGFSARDVDVVCILPWSEYRGRFLSMTGGYERLQAELGKLSAYAARHLGVNVDLKIQTDIPSHMDEHAGKPRRRIDTLPFEDDTIP